MTPRGFHHFPRKQRGVSVIMAVFILLLFAVLAGLMASVIATTHTNSAEDVIGARTYQAARGGIEWGLYQVLDPEGVNPNLATSDLPACYGTQSIAGLGATVNVSCTAYPQTTNYYQEGNKRIRVYLLSATATNPGPGGLTIERRLDITVEQCLDTVTSPHAYGC